VVSDERGAERALGDVDERRARRQRDALSSKLRSAFACENETSTTPVRATSMSVAGPGSFTVERATSDFASSRTVA
jgi:hypothetical protein